MRITSCARMALAIGLLLLASGGLSAEWPDLRLRSARRQASLRPKLRLVPKGHPRIFIRSFGELDPVRERIESDPNVAEVYRTLRDWAYSGQFHESKGSWQPYLQLQARTVVYGIENRDKELLPAILAQMDDLCQAENTQWTWTWTARSLAMAYDWLYDDLTPAQREKYGRRALECAKQGYSVWQQPPNTNHMYIKQAEVLYTGLALHGDGIDDGAAEQMILDGLEQHLLLGVQTHDLINAGDGGWQESMSYHSMFTYAFAHALEAWHTASGEDTWGDFSGLDGDAHFCLYLHRPFDNRKIAVADGGGRAVDRYISYYMPLLSRRRRDGLARYWSDWIKERSRETDEGGKTTLRMPHMWWPYVLWYDPDVPTVTPDKLPLARLFGGIGYIASLSGWKEDAVFSMFICEPWWCGGHQHLDANSFIIHRYAPLAIDPGHKGYNITRGNYYARTIAHNTVTVCDPQEKFTGGVWGHSSNVPVANDGGHEYVGGTSMPEDFVEGGPHHNGRILAFIHKPEFTYAVGDATRYFKSYKVKEHQRAFLHVQPDLFIVFDRVESTDPSFKKRWLLHTATEPEVSGATLSVTNGEWRLWCQTLLPTDPELVIVAPPEAMPEPDPGEYPGGYPSHWRVEISPRERSLRDYFVHVLAAPATGVAAKPEASAQSTETEIVVTAVWSDRTVTASFSKSGPLTGTLRITSPDGSVQVRDSLDQRVQTNAELIRSHRKP